MCLLPTLLFIQYGFLVGLYLVGEKGEKGLPGPPGRCDCDTTPGANNAPFGSYTQRGGPNKVPAVRPCSFTINPLPSTECVSSPNESLLINRH